MEEQKNKEEEPTDSGDFTHSSLDRLIFDSSKEMSGNMGRS